MSKLVLGSGGIFFENDEDPILNHIFSLIEDKSNMKMVFLPTAGHDTSDDDEMVEKYCMAHGFKEFVSLKLSDDSLSDEYIRETILSASVIYARGGNLKFLRETWRRRNVDPIFREAYDKGIVLAGHSSGAMCWCKTGYDDCGIDDRFMFIEGVGLIPYILCPHFEDWPSFLEDVKMQELDGIGIDNDIVISIVDGEYTVVDSGRNPKHTAYYLPANEGYVVKDLQKEHCEIKNL